MVSLPARLGDYRRKERIEMEIELTLEDKKNLMTRKKTTKDWLRVDSDKCTGCGDCTIVCEMNLYRIREGKAQIVEDYRESCYECGACYLACEADAIEFEYPPGGEGIIFIYG